MKNKQNIALVIIVIGLALGLVSIFADYIGVGSDSENPDFGSRQVIGLVAGIVILAAGLGLFFYGRKLPPAEPPK